MERKRSISYVKSTELVEHIMLNCLVIGGDGNLGTSLRSINDWHCISLGRKDWGNADVLFANKVDLVICVAGSLIKPAKLHPVEFVDSNVLALMRTLEISKKHNIPRIFFISSCAVYGALSQTTEQSDLRPISLNGHAKLLCEKILAEFCKANGMNYSILRVFNMFGGLDHFSVLHQLTQSITTCRAFRVNNRGQAQRDFVHVDDVANVIFKLANLEKLPCIVNIGSGTATKISDVVDRFRALNSDLQIVENTCEEVEYSRADITLLNSIIDYKFCSIFDSISKIQTGYTRETHY